MASKTDKIYTPKELAEATGVDAKRIRQYLRSNFTRSVEAKNTSWAVDADVAKDVKDHFAKAAKADATDES